MIFRFSSIEEFAFIVIANQIDLISSPASSKFGILEMHIPASPFTALSQQVGENPGFGIYAPFPEFRKSAEIPRPNIFSFGFIDCDKILSRMYFTSFLLEFSRIKNLLFPPNSHWGKQ
jgi:hypothetical protein